MVIRNHLSDTGHYKHHHSYRQLNNTSSSLGAVRDYPNLLNQFIIKEENGEDGGRKKTPVNVGLSAWLVK